jgi:hypothetical protein
VEVPVLDPVEPAALKAPVEAALAVGDRDAKVVEERRARSLGEVRAQRVVRLQRIVLPGEIEHVLMIRHTLRQRLEPVEQRGGDAPAAPVDPAPREERHVRPARETVRELVVDIRLGMADVDDEGRVRIVEPVDQPHDLVGVAVDEEDEPELHSARGPLPSQGLPSRSRKSFAARST